jgi:hypothetical protein
MIDTLTALRNDPDNEELQEKAAKELFERPETLTPALLQALTEPAAVTTVQKPAVTVVEATVTAVASDLQSAATAAIQGVEGALEGALGSVAPALAPSALALPTPAALFGMPAAGRVTWKNYVTTQIAHPLKIEKPDTLDALKAIMTQAASMDCPVRAVGSGHAWSDSALTDGIVIETHGLNKELLLDTLKDGIDPASLYATEAGVRLQALIDRLKTTNRALINMGSYTGQTLAGVISTSTHGSGLELGSFSSAVATLVVVRADGSVQHIEPSKGVTDPAKFAAKFGAARTLKQDDDLFHASVVGVGCLGIIYAATIKVRPLYYLEETRNIHPWHEVKAMLLEPGPGNILNQHRHVEVLVNPHKVKKPFHLTAQNYCLLTTRDVAKKPPESHMRQGKNVFEHLIGKFTGVGLAALFNSIPTLSPSLLQEAIEALDKPAVNVYDKILNIGFANEFPAVCAEYGVDVNKAVPAMEAIFDAAAKYQKSGIYHSSPVAMRWVAKSPGYLSMQPVPTCMIEIPNLLGVHGYPDIYFRYETMLVQQFGARPHWGQMNFLSSDGIKKLYPNVDKWLAVFQKFNQNGRFSSVFTNRVGFSSNAP